MNRTLRKLAARILTAAALIVPVSAFAQSPATPTAANTSAARPLSAKEVYNSTLKGTAWVVTPNGWGTGWVVDAEKKLVITNNHVIDGLDVAEVYFPQTVNGKVNTDPDHYRKDIKAIKVKVIDRDLTRDLALLQLESIPAGVTALKRASESVEPGDLLRTVGSLPQGSEGLWGTAAGEVRLVTPHRAPGGTVLEVESNIPTNAGNSGGPIVNDRGEVVGTHRAVRLDAINVSIHIDITEVNAYLKEALPLVDAKTAAQFLARGKRQIKVNRLALAQADLTEAIKLDANLVEARILRAAVMIDRNDAKSSLADLDAALKLEPKSTRALVVRGQANRVLGKTEDALADFDAAIQINEKNIEAQTQRGLTLLLAKKPADAIAAFNRAIELNPKDDNLLALRATAHVALGKTADAIADRKAAIKLNAFHTHFNELGILLFRSGDYQGAGDAFAQASRLLPNNPVYHANLGDAQRFNGHHAEAAKAYSDAIQLVERGVKFDLTFTFFGRGVSRRELKEFQGAVSDLNRAIALNGKVAKFYVERGLAQKAIGATEAATEDFAVALKIDPKAPVPTAAVATKETEKTVAVKADSTKTAAAKVVPEPPVKSIARTKEMTSTPAIVRPAPATSGCASGRGCH